MARTRFTVNGTAMMVTEGVKALEAMEGFLATLGDDAEVAEFKVFENMEVEATVFDGTEFVTVVWNGERWAEWEA